MHRALSVLLALGLGAGGVVGLSSGAVAEDPPLTFAISDPAPVTEAAGTVSVVVTLSAASAAQTSVALATSDGSATAGSDYTATNQVLFFPAGITQIPLDIPILDDGAFEPAETFTVTLTSPSGAGLGTAVATVTVIDDDPAPSEFSVPSGPQVVAETAPSVTVVVSRTNAEGASSIGYTTVSAGAVADEDFVATSGTLEFAAGETSKPVTVTLLDDLQPEGNQSFAVRLVGAAPPATIDPFSYDAVITTVSDDVVTRIGFAATPLIRSPAQARVHGNLRAANGVGLVGRTVYIVLTPADGSSPASVSRVAVTKANGAFDAFLRPTRLSYVQAVYVGQGGEQAAFSSYQAIRVQLSVPTVSGVVSIRRGRTTTFSGLVTPGNVRPVVKLQWLRPDGRVADLTGTFRTGPDGRYALTRSYALPGTFRLRVVALPSKLNDGSSSRVFTLQVT